MTRKYPNVNQSPPHDLLTIDEVAEITPFKKSTFARWRLSWPDGDCRGPRPVRVEGRVFYRRSEVEAWLKGDATAEASGG